MKLNESYLLMLCDISCSSIRWNGMHYKDDEATFHSSNEASSPITMIIFTHNDLTIC